MRVNNKPMGKLLALQYREASMEVGQGRFRPIDVFRVHFRVVETGETDHFDLPNGDWGLQNSALQFMALYGYRPSELDTLTNVRDDHVLVPLSYMNEDEGYGLARAAMSGAQSALEDAEWFAPDAGEESNSGPQSASHGGGGPDPGTGNTQETETESESDVTAEIAGDESDAGVEVTIE